jgi:hypothetical protein
MEERIRTLQHQGKQILLIDFSGCQSAEIISLLADVQEQVAGNAQNSVLTLADFTGAHVDKNVATRIKEVLVFDRPYVRRSAWVGKESLPHVFLDNFKTFSQRELPIFSTRQEALDWLIKD